MEAEIQEIEQAFNNLYRALQADTEEQWDKLINKETLDENDGNNSDILRITVCADVVINKNSHESDIIRLLVATYDNDNIKITIDASRNHGRAHIHIGVKQDQYHSASIAIDDGTILNNTGTIPDWKINKIINWVLDNQQLLGKIYRCVNPWGDVESAKKRINKLPNF